MGGKRRAPRAIYSIQHFSAEKPHRRWWVLKRLARTNLDTVSYEGAIPVCDAFPAGSVYPTRGEAEQALRRFRRTSAGGGS